MIRGKSGAKSEKLRAEANRLFVQKKFHDALLKYNESLCFAEAESENLGLAYANRAAVYFEMKLHDKCLTNVQLAKENHFPEKNYEILRKREEASRKSLEKEEKVTKNFFNLTYPMNKNLPNIADCLELKIDEKYGRHIVTNRELNVGDIVAIDEPKFRVLKADSRYTTCFELNIFQRCANCLKDNLLSLIPCSSCCKTMYCSIDCMNSAQQRHHQYECEIIDELLTSGILHIVVRMFFEGLSLFDGDIHEMEKYLHRHDEPMTIFDIDLNDLEISKKLFALTISMAPRMEKPLQSEFENVFQETEKLRNLWSENKSFIRKTLSKLAQVGSLYVHGIGSWTRKLEGIEADEEPKNPSLYQQLIGNGCYLFCSLLNHSCAPNIKRLNVEDKIVVIVSRPIAKGGQLFDSYRLNFNSQPKVQRQEALLQDYGFICDCEACADNWPTNQNLQVYSEELLEFAWTAHEDLPFLTVEEAKKKLVNYYDIFTTHHKHFPSAELIVLQECIANCLIAITKPALQFP